MDTKVERIRVFMTAASVASEAIIHIHIRARVVSETCMHVQYRVNTRARHMLLGDDSRSLSAYMRNNNSFNLVCRPVVVTGIEVTRYSSNKL